MSDLSLHPLWTIILTFGIALIPLLVGLTTSYVKVSIVVGMVRSAIGAQQVPGPMVVMALAISMTCYIMAPVVDQSFAHLSKLDYTQLESFPSAKEIQKISVAFKPWITFLEYHSGKRELLTLQELSKEQAKKQINETKNLTHSIRILLPAFLLTELKEAFTMGLVLLIPFLVIDIVIANILVGLGMFMVSPVMIALPVKLLLFVVSDAWLLLTRGLIQSYTGV